MPNRAQKQRMIDYLVAQLESGGHAKVEPKTEQLVSGIDSSFIEVDCGDSLGALLLADQKYPRERFNAPEGSGRRYAHGDTKLRAASAELRNRNYRIAPPIFYKDGTTFFRSAAARPAVQRKRDGRSLKDINGAESVNLILFSPEECYALERVGWLQGKRFIQYFQPDSDRLDEKVVSFEFVPVAFDYSHLDSRANPFAVDRDSKRYFRWVEKFERDGALVLRPGPMRINGAPYLRGPEGVPLTRTE